MGKRSRRHYFEAIKSDDCSLYWDFYGTWLVKHGYAAISPSTKVPPAIVTIQCPLCGEDLEVKTQQLTKTCTNCGKVFKSRGRAKRAFLRELRSEMD